MGKFSLHASKKLMQTGQSNAPFESSLEFINTDNFKVESDVVPHNYSERYFGFVNDLANKLSGQIKTFRKRSRWVLYKGVYYNRLARKLKKEAKKQGLYFSCQNMYKK